MCLRLSFQSGGAGVAGGGSHGTPPPRPPPPASPTARTHGAPPPRPPPPVPASPTARTAAKRTASHGPPLAAIVESSQTQSQLDDSEEPQHVHDDGDPVVLHDEQHTEQISTDSVAETAESAKPNQSCSTPSQSSIDEGVEATEELAHDPPDSRTENKDMSFDTEDIDAIVAEFEQQQQELSQANDVGAEAQNDDDSEVVVNNGEGSVAFKPKKPLGYSKSLPVPSSNSNVKTCDTVGSHSGHATSESGVSTTSEDNLIGKDQADHCEMAMAKKKRGGSFFNKWRNRAKNPEEDAKSQTQSEQNLTNRHSNSDLVGVEDDANSEHCAADAANKREGLMRKLSRIVKNQGEDTEDGGSMSTAKKRKSRLEQKIIFVDLSMEDVPRNPPHKKMTYGEHAHVGMCLIYRRCFYFTPPSCSGDGHGGGLFPISFQPCEFVLSFTTSPFTLPSRLCGTDFPSLLIRST